MPFRAPNTTREKSERVFKQIKLIVKDSVQSKLFYV